MTTLNGHGKTMRKTKRASGRTGERASGIDVKAALAMLKAKATRRTLDGMARYGLPSDHALGVAVSDIQKIAKEIGRDHTLALALWKTGVYEARMLTAFVDDPALVTTQQMDAWCKDFDNWGIVDTLCFKLFDQSPRAWSRVVPWSKKRDEFGKRAAFVMLACLAAHDKKATDKQFLDVLPLIEAAATDERNFVKKGVSWGLRMIGRRNATLRTASINVARRLADASSDSARWIGKGALKDLKA